MRLTIVCDDNIVIKDGIAHILDSTLFPSNIHALQWYGTWGEVEFKHTPGENKLQNKKIDNLSEFESLLSAWEVVNTPVPLTAEQEQTNRRAAFKNIRAQEVRDITVNINGNIFNGNEVSQVRMNIAIIRMQRERLDYIQWTMADNTVANVTIDDLTEALVQSNKKQSEIWQIR